MSLIPTVIPGTTTPSNYVSGSIDSDRQTAFIMEIFSGSLLPKITKDGLPLLNVTSVTTYLNILLSLKLLSAQLDLIPGAQELSSYISGRQIPTLFQNIVNACPVLPRYTSIPISLINSDFYFDQNSTLKTWATNIVNSSTVLQLMSLQTNFSNSNFYKGALSSFSLNIVSTTSLLFNVNFITLTTNPKGGPVATYSIQNAPSQPDVATFKPGNAYSSAVNDDLKITVQFEGSVNLTPQLLFITLYLGILNGTLVSTVQSLSRKALSVEWQLTDSTHAIYLADYASKIPNPDEVEADQNEGTPKNTKPSADTSVQLYLTKVRKSKQSKVSAIKVNFKNLKSSKKVSEEEKLKFKTLLGTALNNIEKAANVLQIDSTNLINSISKAWPNALETVDPDVGKQISGLESA